MFSVLEFYKDKTVFLTGVTGFVGKALLEKLLRQCPTLKRVYVFIREKRSQTAQQRLNNMLSSSPLFKIHQEKIDLVEAVNGDITDNGLALTDQDRQKLIDQVDVVIHSAATINFTGVLKTFIELNIDGTDSIMRLCQQMKHLQSIVYVSTAYGNCHLGQIQEKVYPVVQNQDFESYLEDLKEYYSHLDLEIGHKALLGRPNPYTLSKSITEWMIEERYKSLPVIICRPSIVSHSNAEPMPGWCDSNAGYSGAFACIYTGIAKTFIVDLNCKADLIPVDLLVNSLIVAGAFRASPFYSDDRKVVHMTSGENPITWKEIKFYSLKNFLKTPTMKNIRPVSFQDNPYKSFWDKIRFKWTLFFSQYLFALVFDLICLITGNKPFMMRTAERVQKSSYLLRSFSCNEWDFVYNNLKFITNLIKPQERNLFITNVHSIKWRKYFHNLILGIRQFTLKDSDSTFEKASIRSKYINVAYMIFDLVYYSMVYLFIKSILTWNTIPKLNILSDNLVNLIYYLLMLRFLIGVYYSWKHLTI